MRTQVIALVLLAFVSAQAFSSVGMEAELFDQFMKTYNKQYASEEETAAKYKVFCANLLHIAELELSNPDAQFGITKFADVSPAEFKRTHLNLKPKATASVDPLFTVTESPLEGEAPTAWDWRANGAVTDVKNQGQCGSCWTFSATANIEGQYFLSKAGALTSFSEQQIVDCDKLDGCDGCNGGWMIDAFIYVQQAGGQETDAAYPYDAENGKCKFSKSKAVAFVSGYFNVSSNETVMLETLYATGPLSIAVDASSWQFYYGGVFDPLYCGHTLDSLDHGVTLVGYGVNKDIFGTEKPYWIIKNSWGSDWGVQGGYMLLARGKGECGVNLAVSSSVVQA